MELYHALNRGTDKRQIFMEQSDYVRFVHDLYVYNDKKPATNMWYSHAHNEVGLHYIERERQPLVHIHGWCLMRNHYHLLLSECIEGGITQFLRKLNTGFTNHFNAKYERSGVLFQGKTKKVLIENDAHFLYILHYIHLNPLDYHTETSEWRTGNVSSARKALEHLHKYCWSSFLDYCGEKNFPSIIDQDLFRDVFPDYSKSIRSYLKDIDTESLDGFMLE